MMDAQAIHQVVIQRARDSRSSVNSEELMENALQDLIQDAGRRRGWCQGEPITEAGKRRQIAKVMSLLLVPMIALLAISSYFVAETLLINKNNEATRSIINFSIEIGEVLRMLQLERDQSVLYLSNIGPATKTFLLKQYLETNEYIDRLSMWPGELQSNTLEYVRSRKAFVRHLTEHRNSLDIGNYTVFDEIYFYNGIIRIFHKWLYKTLDESRYSTMWKTLVAYQKIIFARLYVGVERALGSYFFSKGGFLQRGTYEWYNEGLNVFRHSFKRAQNFSKLVKPIASYDVAMISGQNLSTTINKFRQQIQYQNVTHSSLADARYWFDNMTSFLDILFNIQTELADDILGLVNNKQSSTVVILVISILLVVVVVGMVPLLIQAIHRTTSDIQSYAIILADKTKELDRERAKTDSLLHQMLPKQVARQLKQGQAVRAKYYRSVTVFFSDIVGFTGIAGQISPLQLVAMLNHLYNLLDKRIDQYDVYKVETIGESYMVASGLPSRNGNRHAFEIANMSLALVDCTKDVQIPHAPEGSIQLRIGIHTGPVVAGIVGSQLPKYCLFGDTVNTASRIESTGMGDKIHISSETHKLLDRHGGYKMAHRGTIDLKGKGPTETYWLLGHHSAPIPKVMKDGIGSGDPTPTSSPSPVPPPENRSQAELKADRDAGGRMAKYDTIGMPVPKKKPAQDSGKMTIESDVSSSVSHRSLLSQATAEQPTPISMEEVNKTFEEKAGTDSPPILQLTEGYHY